MGRVHISTNHLKKPFDDLRKWLLGFYGLSFSFRIALINDLQISFFNGFAIIKFPQILFVLIDVSLNFRVIRYVRDCPGFFLASLPW